MTEPNDQYMIEAEGLTKSYAGFTAVNNLSFSCRKGEIVGFLGPNGAGKTTTMRMLTGYMPPTQGDAYIGGHHTIRDTMAARQTLGYLPETVPLYPEMSVEGYLEFIGRVRRIDNVWDRVDEVLEEVNLLDRAESYINTLSKGMRQRVGLAQALLHDPDVLILDEPTIGLDPAQIVEIRDIIADVGRQRTVLLSTHILAEVEQICNRVIMVIDGQIKADMSMADIQKPSNAISMTLATPDTNVIELLGNVPGVMNLSEMDDTAVSNGHRSFNITLDGDDATRIRLAETAVSQNWGLLEMSNVKTSLESIFLEKLSEVEFEVETVRPKTVGEEE